MPKTTIYIPDGLWGQLRARAAEQKASVSQVIQTALKHVLESDLPRPPFAQSPPAIPEETAARLRERLTREAREIYEAGFQSGLRLADRLSWSQLDRLAAVDWDLGRWTKTGDDVFDTLLEFDRSEEPELTELMLTGALVELVDPLSFRQGKLDALKAVWSAVAAPDVSKPETEGGGESTNT